MRLRGDHYGPEYPTLAEQFVSLFHVPYLVGCFLIVLTLGPGLSILTSYLSTMDISRAVPPWLQPTPEQLFLNSGTILWILLLFYAPRYIRKKVLDTEEPISSILPNGREDFHKLFGGISSITPQLIGLAIFIILDMITVLPPPLYDLSYILNRSNGIASFPFSVLPGAFFSIGGSSTIWAYVATLLGIHRMSRVPLKLPSSSLDPTLGLNPVGSLSLSLARTYLGVLALMFIVSSGLVLIIPVWLALMFGLTALGPLMFFLPIGRFHNLMLLQKTTETNKLRKTLAEKLQNQTETSSPSGLNQILVLDLMKREVASMPTWPFNTQTLTRLFAIVVSLLTILLARIIALILHI